MSLLGRLLGRNSKERTPSGFVLALSDFIDLNPAEVMQAFFDQWGTKVACEENQEWADPVRKSRKYMLTDGKQAALVTVTNEPLRDELVKLTLEASSTISAEDKSALQGHQASVLLESVPTSQSLTEQMQFATQVLLVLFRCTPAVGYVSLAGQMYRTMESMKPFLAESSMSPEMLYLLNVGVQNVDEGGSWWMHTHGLGQFGLPDLQIRFSDKAQANYYHDLLSNTSIYGIVEGPVIKVGDTAELAGDGVVYKIVSVNRVDSRHFGSNGALDIRPQLRSYGA